MMRATKEQIQSVGDRLKRGEGWIGYRSGCEFLYFAFYPSPGAKQKFINTGSHNPEEAYRQLLAARQHTAQGDRLLPQEAARLRYEDLMQLLLDDYREKRRACLYSRKTKDGGTEWVFGGKDDLDAFFKRIPITSITALKIKEFVQRQRRQGYADPTIRRQLTCLRTAFTLAKQHDLITDDHIPSFVMPTNSPPRKGFLDLDQFKKLYDRLPERIRLTVLFIYYTGCRSGAAKQITWGMVNSDCTEIHAPGEIIKNDEDWEIPLVGPLQPISDALKAARRKSIQSADTPVFNFKNFSKLWNQTCHELKLGVRNGNRYNGLHPHDFRRSAARNLIKAGVPEQVAMKITGHKTREIFRRYNIVNNEDVKEALIRVGNVQSIKGC